jgi:hypothetical protein
MGKKSATKPAAATPNKTKGKPRPFIERNQGRLTKMAGYFQSLVKDLARAGDDAWTRAARSAAEEANKSLGEVGAAFDVAPKDYAPTRKGGNRKATSGWKAGDHVTVNEANRASYPERATGVGTILAVETGGLMCKFTGDIAVFVRAKHVTKAA